MNLTTPDGRRILFTEAKLRCPLSGVILLAPGFGDALVQLRMAFGHPMYETSICRSAEHNLAVGGHKLSLHLYHGGRTDGTAAIDIKKPRVDLRWRLAGLAREQGWSLGVGSDFWHLDLRRLAGLTPTVFGY